MNLSLLEKAHEDFRLVLPGRDALEPAEGRDIDVDDYMVQVEEVIQRSAPDRWAVEPDRVVLGFFSFNKLLMYLDLGDPSVADSEIIAALFGDQGFSEFGATVGDQERVDNRLTPTEVFHVLDADSSQALAIYEAGQGRNMVIQGPPGTGKSQTIANVIADAVARGKRVLFVSEKMAALEVVMRRLANIGLGGACLELHSHKTNKREMLDELNRSLNLSPQPTDGSGRELLEQLSRTRGQLNEYADAINNPVGDTGISPHVAFGELLALQYVNTANPIARRELPGISGWTGTDYRRKKEAVEDLRLWLQSTGVPIRHPFWGSRLRVVLPDTRAELQERLESALTHTKRLADASNDLAGTTNLPCPEDISAAYSLLMASRHAVDAPDTTGLSLKAPQWENNGGDVWDLVESGLQWQWMRWKRIHAMSGALKDLEDSSISLAGMMCMDHPADVSQSADILAAAKCAVGAPDASGLDLSAPQWESSGERIFQLLARGLQWKRIRTDHDSLLLPQAWDTDFQNARLALNTDGRSRWRRWVSSSYKRAKKQLAGAMRGELPVDVDQQVSFIDAISEEQSPRAEINEGYADIVPVLGRHWNGHNTDWEAIEPAVRWWLYIMSLVAFGRLTNGALRLLRRLDVRLVAESVQPQIKALDSAIRSYVSCAESLKELLEVTCQVVQEPAPDMNHLSYIQQRQLFSRLIEELPTGTGRATGLVGRVISETPKRPKEIAQEIVRLYDVVGPVLRQFLEQPGHRLGADRSRREVVA